MPCNCCYCESQRLSPLHFRPYSAILEQITSVQAENTRLVLENRELKAKFEDADGERNARRRDMERRPLLPLTQVQLKELADRLRGEV